ncbi:MAG: tetratricopeptide repeat protein 38 family protein [Pseudooceanicola sp.]|jgi:tetratricopeptide (TPR) repeat protein|nr:tetratricopeptide repeat protein 38 family protein [Pseudooceanicola sp.]
MTNEHLHHPDLAGDAAAQADWVAVQTGFLAHSAQTPQAMARLLAARPEFSRGHAVMGLFYLLLGRAELIAPARDALNKARAPQSGADTQYVAALEAWLAGAPSRAVVCCETILRDSPHDALAMKLSQAIRFVLGDSAGMRRSIERVLPAYGADHPARGYALGCHAFTLEETGAYSRAEIIGRQALWLAPDDAWGLHAVAHVHDMTGRSAEGLAWLTGREGAWAHCNNFRYHVWWHMALMLLDQGDIVGALALYDGEIRAERTDDYRDIANATSLLMRIELEGGTVGTRWEELGALCAARTGDGCLIFADLHYMLALDRSGRAADSAALLKRVARDGAAHPGEFARCMADPGQEAMLGLRAFAVANWSAAFTHLARARATLPRAGGSHAQRDIFERMTIDAALRAGFLDDAERLLSERTRLRAMREDLYCAKRRDMIEQAREPAGRYRVPAQ